MSFALALFFGSALLVAAYAVTATVAHKWPRIEAIVEAQGVSSPRIIRYGQVRHSGHHVRLIVVNGLGPVARQSTVELSRLKAA